MTKIFGRKATMEQTVKNIEKYMETGEQFYNLNRLYKGSVKNVK